MSALASAAGVALIALVLYDAFRTLFVPEGRGALNNAIARLLWSLTKAIAARAESGPLRHRILSLAGPGIFVTILLVWTAVLVIGFALIYLPALPEQFRLSSGLAPTEQDGFLDAFYFSFSTLSSTGFGDISAESGVMRMVGIAEGVCGMVVLGVALSWLLSLYPAISRRRASAESIALHERAGLEIADADPDLVRSRLTTFSGAIVEVSRDLAKFPILYYFMETRSDASLPRQIDPLRDFVEQAASSPQRGVREAGALLEAALESLEKTLREQFFEDADDGATLERFRDDHLVGEERGRG